MYEDDARVQAIAIQVPDVNQHTSDSRYMWDEVVSNPDVKILVPAAMPAGTDMPKHVKSTLQLLNISLDRIVLYVPALNRLYRFTNRFVAFFLFLSVVYMLFAS